MSEVVEAWKGLAADVRIDGTGIPLPSTRTYGFLQRTVVPVLRFFLRIKPTGMERIPRKGAAIFAANHLSHVDPVVVISTIRKKLHYLAKDEHFTTIGVSFIVKATGQIKTERESGASDALARASDILSSGRCLGIFPEGTRSKNTEAPFLLKGKTGVARLAASHPDVPVMPIALVGTREVMAPKIHKIPRPWKKMAINCGECMTWNSWLEGNVDASKVEEMVGMEDAPRKQELAGLYRRFTDDLMDRIKQLGAP